MSVSEPCAVAVATATATSIGAASLCAIATPAAPQTPHSDNNNSNTNDKGDDKTGAPRASSRDATSNHTTSSNNSNSDDDELASNRRSAIIGYFGSLFGMAAISTYFGLVLNAKGFTPTQVGVLVNAVPLANMTLLPVVSFIADRFRCAVVILCACAVGATVCVAVFCAVVNRVIVVLSFLLLTVCQTPMSPLLDRHTLMLFPATQRAELWGYVRAFGAYGWGLGSLAASAAVWLSGTWNVVVLQYLLGQVALLYCMRSTRAYVAPSDVKVRARHVVTLLAQHPRLVLFLFASCVMGMGYSIVNTYLFIFLDTLHAPTVLLGLTVVFTISTEVPLFQCARYLYRYVTYRQMMTGAMLLWAARVAGYSLLTRPWLVLLLEPLHGVTFGLMWLPGIKALSSTFPPQLTSCATGVLSAFVSGIGPLIGNPLGGVLYDRFGARAMFRAAAASMLVVLALYHIADRTLERYGWTLGVYDTVGHDDNSNDDNDDNNNKSGSGGGSTHVTDPRYDNDDNDKRTTATTTAAAIKRHVTAAMCGEAAVHASVDELLPLPPLHSAQ